MNALDTGNSYIYICGHKSNIPTIFSIHNQKSIILLYINESYLLSVHVFLLIQEFDMIYGVVVRDGCYPRVLLPIQPLFLLYSFVVFVVVYIFGRKGRLSSNCRDLFGRLLMLFSLNVITLNRFVVGNSMRLVARCRFYIRLAKCGTRLRTKSNMRMEI